MIKYLHTVGPISESILVTGEYTRTIASTNPRFPAVRDYLENARLTGAEVDAAVLLKMLDAGIEALKTLSNLSERVTYNGADLFFDGDKLDDEISHHIVRMIRGGDDHYHSFVAFLENLWNNPSPKMRTQLFTWIQSRKFTITEDGRFLAYKGVRGEDNHSLHHGKANVNGKDIVGYIPNPIGAIVTMPRSNVDDDTYRACSTGLHAGTHGYAKSYGDKLLLVAINPRDVVSVPNDASFQKLRVCRYEVLDNAKGQIEDTTYVGRRRWNPPVELVKAVEQPELPLEEPVEAVEAPEPVVEEVAPEEAPEQPYDDDEDLGVTIEVSVGSAGSRLARWFWGHNV